MDDSVRLEQMMAVSKLHDQRFEALAQALEQALQRVAVLESRLSVLETSLTPRTNGPE